ncbi:MAG: Hsp70 family protein [Gammaproteobacteria bacterium]
MSETIIGIDLGTTNSEVAVVRDGRVVVLDVGQGTKLFPSFVGLADDGTLLLGEPAKNQYALHPQRTIKSIKRRMGSDSPVSLGEQQYTPQEISAMILRRLKAIATQYLGEDVARAVITVPAFFSDAQRQATREAGELAGLSVARIINEPTAAALAYEGSQKDRKRILVYDLGGGTFDVSVVKMERGVVEVLASHGNNHLGGDDFDERVVDHCLTYLQESHAVDGASSPQTMARIARAAETAKIALSNEPYANIEEEYLLEHQGTPLNLSLELARDDYEAMIEPFIAETLEAAHIALDGAGLTVRDLDEVLLVGGATRTPLISQRLEEALGLAPRAEVDPELCVAAGAAIQAAIIAGDPNATVLVDVTPYTFGTSAIAELEGEMYPYRFVPLIRKNTPIPVTKSEVFHTAYDGQDTVDVGVYQGEDPDALNNTEIGKFRVEGLRDVAHGNPVIASFSLDLDGILHVSAREKETGLEKGITIANAIARFESEELEAARQRIDSLFGEETRSGTDTNADRNREATQARALIEKAERLLAEASPEDREDLVDQIEALNDSMHDVASQAFKDAVERLSDLIYYLES